MTTQPEALRLAEYMDHALNDPKDVADAVSAELRRLHEENGRLRIVAEMSTLLLDQRSALLEALKTIKDTKRLAREMQQDWCPAAQGMVRMASAAIKTVEGKKT